MSGEPGEPTSSEAALAALRRAALAAAGREPGPPLLPGAERFGELPAELARRELERVLMGPEPGLGLERLRDEGALAALLPEIEALVGFGEGGRQHKDVWEHTKRVVRQSPPRVALRWAALLHDIGKVQTRRTQPDGQVTFHGHAEVGARLASRVLARLAFEPALAGRIERLVLLHLRANQYEPGWTDSAVRRFGREVGELLEDLLDLSRADMTTRYREKRRRGLDQIGELEARVGAIRELDAREPPLPKGIGTLIIERFGLPPGPAVGLYRRSLELAVEAGRLDPREPEEVYLAWLAANRAGLEAAAAGQGPGPRADPELFLDWLDARRGEP